MIFEWDERKRRENRRKQGFDFADCAALFEGPVVTEPDDRFAYGERRSWALGLLQGRFQCGRQTGMKKRATSKKSRSDWKRIDAMRDEDIDYSDIPPLTDEQWARAVVRWPTGVPPAKRQVTLRLDADVLEWFRARGDGYQTHINSLLRSYMIEHKAAGERRTRRRG